MPTHQDETLPQRYAREHQDYLRLCGSMTAEQVADIQLQLHNSLAREQALQQRLTAADELADSWHSRCVERTTERDLLKERADVLEGLLRTWRHGRDMTLKDCAILRDRTDAALKPAKGGGDEN